ncbi:MAG: thiamine diphosphokinase [Lachnospiraceae bacterium]|nr:thiamine diphosphokinase [Lachnospiraceae bacterium]
MRTLIVSGGTIEEDFALDYIQKIQPEYIIAADRGMEFCYRKKIMPDCIIGDYDSVDPSVYRYFRGRSRIEWHDLIPEKDDTDTQIAVDVAMEKGSRQVCLLGATGTRLDHVMGNLHLLKRMYEAGTEAFLVDACNRIRLVSGELILRRSEQFGSYVSILPFEGRLSHVTLTGMKYPLEDADMETDNTLGISNEITGESAEICIGDGLALVVEARE